MQQIIIFIITITFSLSLSLFFSLKSGASTLNKSLVEKVTITLSGPGAVVSYPLMVMADQQKLAGSGIELDFVRWKNPEQLRAMVIGKQVDFSAMPSNLAAIFYNRGHKLSLLNISIWNIMSIVSRVNQQGSSISSMADLVGQEIVVPFKNDMPNIVLKHLLQAQLGEQASKVKIRYSHNLADAAQLLRGNKVQHALLIEPLTSVVLYQSNKQSTDAPILVNAINISEQWQNTFPDSPKLPQAGIIANTTINQDKKLVAKVNQAYKNAALWCGKYAGDCADIVKKYLAKMPKLALIAAINNTGIKTVDAKEARIDLEKFYSLLAKTDAKRIGSKLPDNGFYF